MEVKVATGCISVTLKCTSARRPVSMVGEHSRRSEDGSPAAGSRGRALAEVS